MDMARAIIEGIHEVELRVTPEFQKPREDGEGSFDKPVVKSDDEGVNKGVTWWSFGPAMVIVGRVYPTRKRIDVLGHASSVDARMDELLKMFSWLRDEHRGYEIVVYGGNADAQDMSDLQDAGMIDKFVSEAGDEKGGVPAAMKGPFTLIVGSPQHSKPTGGFVTVGKAAIAGAVWKVQQVDDAIAGGTDPMAAQEFFHYEVLDANNRKVASE